MAKRSKKNGTLNVKSYSFDPEQSKTRRVSAFLLWAAKNNPYQWIPYNVVVQAVNGYRRLPRMDGEEVNLIKNTMTGARRYLQQNGRELVSQPGLGVRSTVDDADTLKVALPKKIGRLQAAKRAVIATTSIIDPSKIPDTEENRPWKRWLSRSVKAAVRELESPMFEKKLLPPGSDDE